MSGFISKQPNGKYCRFSTTVDSLTHINMTFDDYVNVVMQLQHLNEELAKKEAQDVFKYYLRPFDEVLNSFTPENISEKTLIDIVKQMCDPNGKYKELEYEMIEFKYSNNNEFDIAKQALTERASEISNGAHHHK